MPIPFRDADDLEDLGQAAFLKVEAAPGGGGYLGALFLVNARGEPVEFAYNRVETPHGFLWRRGDLRRHAERTLAASLLRVCAAAPRLLLCLGDEVGAELFSRDIRLSIPVGWVHPGAEAHAPLDLEGWEIETPASPEPCQVAWFPAAPAVGSPERRLADRLATHGLLLEPFERAADGLREVYPDQGLGPP